MPSGVGPHVDRELDLAPWRSWTFGDKLGVDAARLGHRRSN
jgi:hypothetical protein